MFSAATRHFIYGTLWTKVLYAALLFGLGLSHKWASLVTFAVAIEWARRILWTGIRERRIEPQLAQHERLRAVDRDAQTVYIANPPR